MAKSKRDRVLYLWFRRNGIPAYVGFGIEDQRFCKHKKYSHNPHLRAIMDLACDELPFVVLRRGLTRQQAAELEVVFIKAIGREDLGEGPLVNRTDGGEGVQNLSAASLIKISENIKKAVQRMTAEQKALRSARHRATIAAKSEEEMKIWRQKMRDAKLGKKASQATRDKKSALQKGKKHKPHGKWITNGLQSKLLSPGEILPGGWQYGRHHAITRDTRWINDGSQNRRLSYGEALPESWQFGRIGDYADKISETLKKFNAERRAQLPPPLPGLSRSEAQSRLRWINDGMNNKRFPKDEPLPENWQYGRIGDFRDKVSEGLKRYYAESQS